MSVEGFRRAGMEMLKGQSKQQENGTAPAEERLTHSDATDYPDGAGRSDKHPLPGFYLMWPGQRNGEALRRGIMYAWIDEEPVLDERLDDARLVETLTFGYEMRSGCYDVTIRGTGLGEIYEKLMLARRFVIRVSGSKDSTPLVTGISVEKVAGEE
jgi:hypothetical protein